MLAVVSDGKETLILGSGRYLLRDPAKTLGRVNIQNLKDKCELKAITESAGVPTSPDQDPRTVPDLIKTITMEAGQKETIGAVTFARANPGFCYVVQDAKGQLRSGVGLTICRSGDKFIDFCDRQNYARTTRKFTLQSQDRHDVSIRVQLRWRLENARVWFRLRGSYTDIFDAIDETIQALLRDAIAGLTHASCVSEAASGYEGIEKAVRSKLTDNVARLGGALLGFEIRELRFPLLERNNIERAEKEAQNNEKLEEVKRMKELEEEKQKWSVAKMEQDQKVQKLKLEHRAEMQLLRDQANLEKMRARAALDKAREQLELEKKEILLKGQKQQQEVTLATEEACNEAQNKIRALEAKGAADRQLELSRAEAETIRVKAAAEAEAKVKNSEAEAKAAQLVGSAYKGNPAFLRLEMEQLNSEMMHVRATAMGQTLKANPHALMPIDLQREMAFLRSNISPIAPIVMGGGGMVTMPTKSNS